MPKSEFNAKLSTTITQLRRLLETGGDYDRGSKLSLIVKV